MPNHIEEQAVEMISPSVRAVYFDNKNEFTLLKDKEGRVESPDSRLSGLYTKMNYISEKLYQGFKRRVAERRLTINRQIRVLELIFARPPYEGPGGRVIFYRMEEIGGKKKLFFGRSEPIISREPPFEIAPPAPRPSQPTQQTTH